MIANNDTNRRTTVNDNRAASPLGWRELAAQRNSPARRGRRRVLAIITTLLLLILIFAAVRLSSVGSASDDQLLLHIGNQQAAIIDLRQAQPISPYLFGANVFPKSGSSSVDKPFTGFMSYGTPVIAGLANAHIAFLRFPGGNWGENIGNQNHILSLDQLNDFSTLLTQTHADGMISARLSSPADGTKTQADLATRANLAGRWVDYMNNRKSDLRTGKYANAPFHPVHLWSVGNEPDRLVNPDTGKLFTVSDYVTAFIQYSIQMHNDDPTIQVFGPEISQFYGLGDGPSDANGNLWMESFIKGVADYERANKATLKYHLLDGISFHRYQFNDARHASDLLLSSTSEWDYMLPPLRDFAAQQLGRTVPIAITEVNTNPKGEVPSRGVAALWWADTLGTLMNQQVEYAAFFSTQGVEAPYPLFATDALHETPMFRVMQMFSHIQRNLVPLGVQHEPISVYATQDDSHQTVSLLFVNKGAATQIAQLSPANDFLTISPWHSLDITLTGYSISLVTLHRSAGAEAYSYIVPFNNDPTTAPLSYTVCGTHTDALANNLPC